MFYLTTHSTHYVQLVGRLPLTATNLARTLPGVEVQSNAPVD